MKTITILDRTELTQWNIDNTILSTTNFWVNSTPEFAASTRNYLKQQDIEYKVSKFDDIDKTKPWLIYTSVEFPFTINIHNKEQVASKQLFQGIPDAVINELVNGNAYIMLSLEYEAYSKSYFDLFYALYRNNPIVPANKIITMHVAYNIHELYDRYCTNNNIPQEDRIQFWFSPHILMGPIAHHSYLYKKTPTNKSKKFISLNRLPRPHRVALTSLLSEYNLLNYGYISLGVLEDNKFQSYNDLLSYVESDMPRLYNLDKQGEMFNLMLSGSKKLVEALPLVIDDTDFKFKPTFGYSGSLVDFYNQSYFSIVGNTYFFAQEEEAVTLNEKEYKAILSRHPFILNAKPGTLALLKDIGFQTFDRWFDESYDLETDDQTRMLKLVNEIDRLCKIDNDTWDRMIEEMMPIIEHNYDWLVNHTNDIIFSLDLKNILEFAV